MSSLWFIHLSAKVHLSVTQAAPRARGRRCHITSIKIVNLQSLVESVPHVGGILCITYRSVMARKKKSTGGSGDTTFHVWKRKLWSAEHPFTSFYESAIIKTIQCRTKRMEEECTRAWQIQQVFIVLIHLRLTLHCLPYLLSPLFAPCSNVHSWFPFLPLFPKP